MVSNKPNAKSKQRQSNVAAQKPVAVAAAVMATPALTTSQDHGQKQQQQQQQQRQTTNGNKKQTTQNNNNNGRANNNNNNYNNNSSSTLATKQNNINKQGSPGNKNNSNNNIRSLQTQRNNVANVSHNNGKSTGQHQQQQNSEQSAVTKASISSSTKLSTNSYAQTVCQYNNNCSSSSSKPRTIRTYTNKNALNSNSVLGIETDAVERSKTPDENREGKSADTVVSQLKPGDILTAALTVAGCAKCSKPIGFLDTLASTGKHHYRKSKSYVGGGQRLSVASTGDSRGGGRPYHRSYSDRRNSFDRNFAERNKDFVPIVPPAKPVLSSSNIAAVIADSDKLTIIERLGKGRISYPIMQCGTLDAPDSSYHQQRSNKMDVYQIDDGFHSDGGTETPPPSPSSGSSIASTSDHGSLESVDTGGTQRLAVLSFEQVRKLHDVMDEKVAIHGRGNFPTLEVTLKDLVNLVRRKLEADVASGGAGVIVKDIRLNGGAASHVLASEDQPYNDLDLIYAIELTSSRHFDRVKTAVLNTLLDLLPEGVSKRRIMPCALKEAYVGKMVKVNNNNDGDRWSLISLGNSPGHKNVELKFVDTMRRQFEFSVDSFQIVLDSLLLFYDCAALPISENFYPTVVGESVYGDFSEALYHLQKKLISTRQPEEIRGGGLLKYCNLLVRNYKPVDPQRIKTLERYMCSRFFIDFPDINTQTVKLEAYLRNHFWGVDEEPLQYQYLMHLREVVEMSTVCLMGHERRQTLMLIQTLAAQVLYNEQQKHQQAHAQEQYHKQQQVVDIQQQSQQQPQTVTLVATQQTQQPQTIYVQQASAQNMTATTTICCAVPASSGADLEQQKAQSQQSSQAQTVATSVPQTIQIQAGPPGLIYANGVYYAPVIPTTICTCNSTWLST